MDIRTGNGFDVHAFGPGDGVTLCGVAIPFDRGLVGHSDADVGMHALTDAIFGALGEGDIGQWFPPSDPAWKGAASEIFLRKAVERAADRGFAVTHLDCTLVCEAPKIGPHAAAMRAALAADRRDRRRSGSASRRPPPSGSASPAAARASPRSPPRRWCGRDAALDRHLRLHRAAARRRRHLRLARGAADSATCCTGSAASRCSRRRPSPPTASATGRPGSRPSRQDDLDPGAHRHRRGRRPVDRADAALVRPLARRRAAAALPLAGLGRRPSCCSGCFDIWKPWPVGWADRRKGPTGVMLDDVRRRADGRARWSRCSPRVAHGWLAMIAEARARALIEAARARGWRIATAESCTGGLVAPRSPTSPARPTSSTAASSPTPTRPRWRCSACRRCC